MDKGVRRVVLGVALVGFLAGCANQQMPSREFYQPVQADLATHSQRIDTFFVVLDTAPTGHTLLLLDATEAYHREIERTASDIPEEVGQLLPRLRDNQFTRVLIVTLPEATPVHEAAALQKDLRRAGIEPFAWVTRLRPGTGLLERF